MVFMMNMMIQEVVEERPTDIYSAIEAANDKYAIQQDFSEDPPYSPPDNGFQASQSVVEPLSLGYGAPLADPLTVYTSPTQTSSRRGKRQKGSSSSSSSSSKGGKRSKKASRGGR